MAADGKFNAFLRRRVVILFKIRPPNDAGRQRASRRVPAQLPRSYLRRKPVRDSVSVL